MAVKKKQDPKDHGSEDEDEERKTERAREFRNKVKDWLDNAEDDEEKFDKQHHEHKESAKGLDAEVRHQFYILVDQNRAEVRRRKMQQRCERPRSLYAGAFEERFHFFPCCKEINKVSHYEWTSCLTCFKETEEILDLAKSESSSSTDSWIKNLDFELRGTRFHSSKCATNQLIPEGDKDTKTMCQSCAKEEGLVVWARNR